MSIFGRVLRRVVARTAGSIYRRRGFIAVGALLIAAVVVASGLNLLPTNLLPSVPTGSGGNAYVGSGDGEPEATVNYIRGQQIGDATLVWDAYSERIRRQFEQRGTSTQERLSGVEVVQEQLDISRQRGRRIQQAQYIGSYPIPNGKMVFYVLVQSSGGRGNNAYVPYTFTLDASGKIDNVE
jgi:hypothetical protein